MRHILRPLAAFAAVTFLASSLASAQPERKPHDRPWGRGKAAYHPTPTPPYRITDEDVKLTFRFEQSFVHAIATMKVIDTTGAATLPFDSIGLKYESVTINGKPATYKTDDAHLLVDVPKPSDKTSTLTIRAIYHMVPQRGIYFIQPNGAYPNRGSEIWTQGETEDTRRWLPTWDEPNMKFTTSVAAIIPKDWLLISNGSMVADMPYSALRHMKMLPGFTSIEPGSHLVAWRESRPHSSYLTSFVAGNYVRTHDTLGALSVDYYTHPAEAAWARQCFGRTPQMIAFFQDFTGTPFPWEKYAQTTVQEFTAGGMENVSATTQTAFALHPPQFEVEQPCDSLASHELAHQWFGDDITTKDWPNIWVNEGFATYFQELWSEHHFGKDQFDLERMRAQDTYFRETRRYWRPVVDYNYGIAQDNFDSSGYPRPGQGIHMLRTLLGDATFKAGIKHYLAVNKYKNTDTRIFEHAMEQTSGRDLKWFFDQWYYTASYPHYVIKETYDPAAKTLSLDVTQKNHDDAIFRMPVVVEATAGGKTVSKSFDVNAAQQTLVLNNITAAPDMVLFDKSNNITRTLDYAQPIARLAYQATHAASTADRVWATRRLGEAKKEDHDAARDAVRAVLLHDKYYGVRVDAADTAASLDDAPGLQMALADKDPRVVIAALKAPSNLEHQNPAFTAAIRSLASSPDQQIRAAAVTGYGSTKAADAKSVLMTALKTPSLQDIVARGALDGLGDLGDASTLGAITLRSTYGYPERVRSSAIGALSKFLKNKEVASQVDATLQSLAASDPYFRARSAAVGALGRGTRTDALDTLAKIEQHDSEESVQNAAHDAILDINDPPTPTRGAGRRRGR
jgi:aminopeptidase N